MTAGRRAVFLDRDGVLNEALVRDNRAYAPLSLNEFRLVEGVEREVARLRQQGLVCIVFTNQPEVARKTLAPEILNSMHDRLRAVVEVDDVYVCTHDPADGCSCHKPKPGMLLAAAEKWAVELTRSFVIGDRRRDIDAGRAVGCYTILIDRPYSACLTADVRVHDLAKAVDLVLARLEGWTPRMEYVERYLEEVRRIAERLDRDAIERLVTLLAELRDRGGRLFFLGVGGGAGHASHAVNDFRKIVGIEAYTPTDNASELTARINDEGWETAFANWLRGSRLAPADAVFVFSVGGGDIERRVSTNVVRALELAKSVGARICGIVGRDGGFTASVADACVIIPTVNPATVTAHTEAFQAVIWHLLVTHPRLQAAPMKWESLTMHRKGE